jgi:hypothetical protein
MLWVGFERTIPASERAKTVHALDRSATVTGLGIPYKVEMNALCARRNYPSLCDLIAGPESFERYL